MAAYNFSTPRLYVDSALEAGRLLTLDPPRQNYVRNVLRLSEGEPVHVFNGREGEWRGTVEPLGRKQSGLRLAELVRPQTPPGDLHYLFAPLKHARLDYMVQKAVEMGASCLRPVATRRTQTARVNSERMQANAIEAAEQCGILTIPEVRSFEPLEAALADWDRGRTLVFCDEDIEPGGSLAPLREIAGGPLAVLVGPEGGFEQSERNMLLALPTVVRLSLGPRILRADTAAVAALTLVQAVVGDWQ